MKRRYHKYTPEQKQWLRDNCQGLFYPELIAAFNAHFRTDLTDLQIKGFLWSNKILTGTRGKTNVIPEGELDGPMRRIKINGKWQSLNHFLRLKELKKAYKEKLKKVRPELYKGHYETYDKERRIKKAEFMKKVMEL